jgi:hypothetical protein
MADEDGLLALQGLHSDLVAFSEHRLQDIERLVNELDGRIEEFRTLLDKKGKSDASRKQLQDGKLAYSFTTTDASIRHRNHPHWRYMLALLRTGPILNMLLDGHVCWRSFVDMMSEIAFRRQGR